MRRLLTDIRWPRSYLRGFIVVALALPAIAHDNPGDVIHALTHRMEEGGVTARLLTARAFEQSYARNDGAAVEDFNAALALQPRYGTALSGLAATLLKQGKLSEAESVARRGLVENASADRNAPYYALIAQVYGRAHRWEAARSAWTDALESTRPEVDWFLAEAQCLAKLGHYDERVEALAVARTRNPSVVLHRAWVRALIDAHQLEQALTEIERRLQSTRWKSSWLILRAQVHAQQANQAAQHRDARAALDELQLRWGPDPDTRDFHLLRDGAVALELLGRPDAARHLRDRGVLLDDVSHETFAAPTVADSLLAATPSGGVD